MPVTPEDLAPGVESVESSGNPYAVSPKGAIGLYQIMPATARQYGYQPGDLYSTDVQKDIYNRHMGYLLNKYGGDARKALAAWNAGEGNVDKGRMPAETRAYVPKVLSRLGGAVSGLLGEGTAEAAEPKKFQYSRSTGTFWTTGPDGTPVQVPTDQVPAAIRTKASKLTGARPATGADKLPTRVPTTPPAENAEQWYERQFGKLGGLGAAAERAAPGTTGKVAGAILGPAGKAAQYVLPGTIGEAAATGANALALGLAPETFGASALIPIGAAMAGGYLEPSDQPWLSGQRLERATIEGGKEIGGLVGAKAIGKGAELTGRWLGRNPMLKESAARIGTGVTKLFNLYPFADAPTTIEKLTTDVANGPLTEATGQNLGIFRDKLEEKIPKYVPGRAAKFAHGLEGLEQVGKAIQDKGEKFTVWDVDAEGKLFPRDMSIGDAITHQRTMAGASYTAAGGPKGGEISWAHREAGHKTRESIVERLNQIGAKYGMPQAGDTYEKMSADYGTAVTLEKIFQGARRSVTTGGERKPFIDQPTLMDRLDKKEMHHLGRLQGPTKAAEFQRAVAPKLAAAQQESGGGRVNENLVQTLLSFLHGPFSPEARAMLPWYARAATARRGEVPATRALATPLVAAPSRLLGGYIDQGTPPGGGT